MISILNKLKFQLLSVCLFLAIWAVVAFIVQAPIIIPSPFDVFKAFTKYALQVTFWLSIAGTFLRCIIAFLISVILGSFIGCLCGLYPLCKQIFSFPLELIRSSPVVSIILLAIFWFTSNTIPIFVAVLVSFPIMVSSVTEGFMHRNKQMQEMAEVYCFTKSQKIKWIELPEILPFFFTGTVSSFGLTWKAVVAGEVLCLPKKGAGTLMHIEQVHLETQSVIALTLTIVCISFFTQKLFAYIIKKKFL